MSGSDVANTVANILPDLSNFPELADRLQQGLLDELFLGRLMDTTAAQGGFLSNVHFHADDSTLGSPGVIDPSELYYDGSSQGGIMGGALTAVSTDFTRAALNVPAMNYSILLPRSVDYDEFIAVHLRRLPRRPLPPAASSASSRCSGTAASRTATRTG